jgi:hypothetical protein
MMANMATNVCWWSFWHTLHTHTFLARSKEVDNFFVHSSRPFPMFAVRGSMDQQQNRGDSFFHSFTKLWAMWNCWQMPKPLEVYFILLESGVHTRKKESRKEGKPSLLSRNLLQKPSFSRRKHILILILFSSAAIHFSPSSIP